MGASFSLLKKDRHGQTLRHFQRAKVLRELKIGLFQKEVCGDQRGVREGPCKNGKDSAGNRAVAGIIHQGGREFRAGMAARPPPRGETNALPSRPLEFPFRTTLAVLGNTAMPYSNPAPVPCMGVSDRPPLLVYQWNHMPWHSSGNVGKEDEALSQLRRLSHHVSRSIEKGQASRGLPLFG